jgi:hypothetical protein
MTALVWMAREEEYRRGVRLNYFPQDAQEDTVLLRSPAGIEERVTGYRIPGWKLRESSSEVLYLHIVEGCNLACAMCGNGETDHGAEPGAKAKYMDPAFLQALGETLAENPFPLRTRQVFESGGEPLLNLDQFLAAHNVLQGLEKTAFNVITNGYCIPLQGMQDYLAALHQADVGILLTYKEALKAEYRAHPDRRFVPPGVNPLAQKIRMITSAAQVMGMPKHVNVIEPKRSSRLRDELCTALGDRPSWVFSTPLFEPARGDVPASDPEIAPCSQAEELSISFFGNVHPHCYHLFQGHFSLGRVGILVEEIR